MIVALLLTACAARPIDLSRQAPPTLAREPAGGERARVTRIVDGDTIVVEVLDHESGPGLGDTVPREEFRVRLVGIDTPESVNPRAPVECFAKEASAALDALVGGDEVFMVKDVEDVDGFDRLLRYVYLGEEMVNARLVANGYAHAYTYPPNIRHSELFVELQREARESERGLWSPDTCDGKS